VKTVRHDDARWVVYGWKRTSYGRQAVHKEGLTSERAATAWALKHVLTGGGQSVIVKLDHGVDANGQRHVVARYGEGKAWWE
jgi:hypothetical protein